MKTWNSFRLLFHENWTDFLREKELKESRRKKTPNLRSERTNEKLETPKSRGIHRNITEFYRSTKVLLENQPIEDSAKDIDRVAGHQKRRGNFKSKLAKVCKTLSFVWLRLFFVLIILDHFGPTVLIVVKV